MNDIENAAAYIEKMCRRWGRFGVTAKEKWHTLRVCVPITSESDFLHDLIYPGHAWIRWPRWVRIYIDWPLGTLLKKIGIVGLVRRYQMLVLKRAWKKAAAKWPHVADEILDEYTWWFK